MNGAPGPLAGVRIVDLAGLAGGYGTMLLAGLGAEVILVEPPGGNPLRHLPPQAPGVAPPEAGLWFAAFAGGKRSVVADLDRPEGRERLRRLLTSADVVVEDGGPDRFEALGLGPDALADVNPGLVWVSITPFGLSGPKRAWRGSDLVAWAASGVLYTTGFPDRAPVAPAPPVQLAYQVASLTAASGALLALRARRLRGGRGELVEVSVAEGCLWLAAETGASLYLDDQVHRVRAGNRRPVSSPFGLFPCADGFVSILALMPAHWQAMAAWIHDETGNEAVLDPVFADLRVRYQALEAIDAWVEELTTRHGKLALFEEGQRRGIPVTPVNTVADLREDRHLEASGFWRTEGHPALGKLTLPGPPFRTTPGSWALSRAPLLGEHTEALLG